MAANPQPAMPGPQPVFDVSPYSARGRWTALVAALLGWMFDGAEMGVFSLIGRPALADLLGKQSEDKVALWFGIVMAGFLVGAATGGVLFGWLGDRLGRVRALTLSVLTYAIFTGLCGMATTPAQLGLLRFVAALGMGGEWSLGVALVMEVWPNRSRAFMAGMIGAAGNLGYMLVGFIGLGLAGILTDLAQWLSALGLAESTVDTLTRHSGWRILMLLGVTPAILTFLIRLFVPESPRWLHENRSGATSHWATRDLLGVVLGALGPALIIYLWAASHTTIYLWTWSHTGLVRVLGSILGLGIATVGYTYPVRRFVERNLAAHGDSTTTAGPVMRRMLLAAALSGVPLLGTWGAAQWAPAWADKLAESGAQSAAGGAKYYTQICLAAGAILGTLLAAMLGDWLGRRLSYTLLCFASLASLVWLYQSHDAYDNSLLFAAFVAGACSASFYGWLPLYLPELFSTKMRATGQGFGFNFGRILAAVGTLQTSNLFAATIQLGPYQIEGGYATACTAMSFIYLVGAALIWFAPETKGLPLPE